eukprot:COSAG05_NODE_10498_length_562_cov_1.105832_1_plen_90_part_01
MGVTAAQAVCDGGCSWSPSANIVSSQGAQSITSRRWQRWLITARSIRHRLSPRNIKRTEVEQKRKVHWVHVRGHSGDGGNDRADELVQWG